MASQRTMNEQEKYVTRTHLWNLVAILVVQCVNVAPPVVDLAFIRGATQFFLMFMFQGQDS